MVPILKFLIGPLILLACFSVKAQQGADTSTDTSLIYCEKGFYQYASFPGGEQKFNAYLTKVVSIPKDGTEEGYAGKIYIQFEVSEKGKIQHVSLTRGIKRAPIVSGSVCDAIAAMPFWDPTYEEGVPVCVKLSIPIYIHLR